MAIPSIVPASSDETIYLVVQDFSSVGRVFLETNVRHTDLETVLKDIAAGQASKPVKVVALNTDEGWSRDVTKDIAIELLMRARRDQITLGESARDFVEFQTGRACPCRLIELS